VTGQGPLAAAPGGVSRSRPAAGLPAALRAGLVAAVLAAGWLVSGLVAAPAADASGCANANGVTVVVDFGSLGGGIRVGCAAGQQSSGLGALAAAGFSYSFVPRQPGFVCQINGLPNPCNGAPTNAYWAYWHGQPGGSWTYSTQGAGTYVPPPGSVEGWAFGAGQPPGIAPPALPASPPPPSTTRSSATPSSSAPTRAPGGGGSTTGGSASAPGGTAAPGGSASGGGTRGGAPGPTATASGGTGAGRRAGGSVTATPTGSGTAGTPMVADPQPAAARQSAGGISAGLVIGVVLIAVLTGLALLARRRRARGLP